MPIYFAHSLTTQEWFGIRPDQYSEQLDRMNYLHESFNKIHTEHS